MKTAKKVLKKLSAVRAVLRKDERDVLDAIVLGEVVAHRMTGRSTGKSAGRSTGKSTEVKAHQMTGNTDLDTTIPRIEFDPDLEEYHPVQE